jgi:hypothetical protein
VEESVVFHGSAPWNCGRKKQGPLEEAGLRKEKEFSVTSSSLQPSSLLP